MNTIFLLKIAEKIKRGEYDQYLTIPFLTRELLLVAVKNKFNKKVNSGGTPILNEQEIKECINEAKEVAAITFATFVKKGFIEITDKGYNLTLAGELALKIRNK